MPGHSSITTTSDTYTSLLPEADPAIAEVAARHVPRARATSENTGREARAQPGEADELVLDDADPLGTIREINSPSAHANGPGRRVRGRAEPLPGGKPQVRAVMLGAPGRIRTCDTRFRRAVLYPLSYEGGALRETWMNTVRDVHPVQARIWDRHEDGPRQGSGWRRGGGGVVGASAQFMIVRGAGCPCCEAPLRP